MRVHPNPIVFRYILLQIQVAQELVANSGLPGPELSFTCRARADVEVTSNSRDSVDGSVADASSDGSFSAGFSLNFFRDSDFFRPVRSNRMFVGNSIFVSIDWSLGPFQDLLMFYIDSCVMEIEGFNIGVIKDNCYANKLHARMEQENLVKIQNY